MSAIELVSPGNKDRAETRRAFAAKCMGYLQQGIGVAVIDIVTSRQAQLHNTMIELMAIGDGHLLQTSTLTAICYRPARTAEEDRLELQVYELTIGAPLPTVPLQLDKGIVIPVELGAVYMEVCQQNWIYSP